MLILASASKARQKLLLNAGIAHKIVKSGIDESSYKNDNPRFLALTLASAKANSVFKNINAVHIKNYGSANADHNVLACDSLFEFQGQIFGKPQNEFEAIERWLSINGKFGYIHTGHCLIKKSVSSTKEEQIKEVITTRVDFEEMNKEEIDSYVKSGEPLSCAGGFAIERKGSVFIKRIDGCYSNVIGLSLPWLRRNYLCRK